MATYKDLQDRIALDYLNRYDLMPAVKRAIKNAIKDYECYRWWFNETATSTVTTVGTASISVPSDFLILDRLEITYGGSQLRLIEDQHDVVRELMAVSATGIPTHYTYRGDKFQLALIPDSAYAVTCFYVHSLAELSADTDSNVWTNEAANLIAHAATVDVLGSTLKVNDPRLMGKHERMAEKALSDLRKRNVQRFTTRLRPTTF